jgi:hypothetical protein
MNVAGPPPPETGDTGDTGDAAREVREKASDSAAGGVPGFWRNRGHEPGTRVVPS